MTQETKGKIPQAPQNPGGFVVGGLDKNNGWTPNQCDATPVSPRFVDTGKVAGNRIKRTR